MPIQISEEHGGKILVVSVSGKLAKADYEHFTPEFERLVQQHGKLRVLFDMASFHGWEAGALWEDIKFDIKHFADIERLAIVGSRKWEHGMATFCKPFTKATVRYFEHTDASEARSWLSDFAEKGLAPSREEVAKRAYFRYVNQGWQSGHDVQHWLEAEAELMAERHRTQALPS
jgi:hypothetical protein